MGDGWGAADRVFRENDGVIDRSQALRGGLSIRSIDRAVASGRWHRVLPGVYRAAQHELTQAGWIRAVSCWAGPASHLAGSGALWWWDVVPNFDGPVQMNLAPHRRLSVPAPLRHRITLTRRTIDPRDLRIHRAIGVVSLPRAVLLGAVEMGAPGSVLLDRALQRRVTLDELERTLSRLAGCRGSTRAAFLVAAAQDGAAAESERLLVRLLRQSDISGWVVNKSLAVAGRRRFPDFLFSEYKLIVEVDGWAFHHHADRFDDDRRRQNALILQGWRVLRFTWHQLFHQPEDVLSEIRTALAMAH